MRGDIRTVRRVLAGGTCLAARNEALFWAAEYGYLAIVRELLRYGIEIEGLDYFGFTPLMKASGCGHSRVAKVLLDHGAQVNVHSGHGEKSTPLLATALMQAAMAGHLPTVQLLLRWGAETTAKDWSGCTALHRAQHRDSAAITRRLLQHGALVDARDEDGRTPLSWSACEGVPALKNKKRASTDTTGGDRSRMGAPTSAAVLLAFGAEVDARDRHGWTPLITAARWGVTPMVQLLLDAGADPTARNQFGWTSLKWAHREKHQAIAELLLQSGASE